jgi:phage terminase Nu1 subunit (DNA packaging protein)
MLKTSNKEIAEFYEVNPRTIQKWVANGMPHTRKIVTGISVSVIDTDVVDQWVINNCSGDVLRRVLKRRGE